MSKCCQYVISDLKVCVCLTIISIMKTQFILSKKLTWTKKGVKGWWEWHKACFHNGVPQESSRLQSKLGLFPKSFGFKRFWNSNTLLPYAMDNNNHCHFKIMC
jgi:hypothetical protein